MKLLLLFWRLASFFSLEMWMRIMERNEMLYSLCYRAHWRWFRHQVSVRIAKIRKIINGWCRIDCWSQIWPWKWKHNNVLTPNIALRSGSLNLNGMLDTWRRFGWLLASAVTEDCVVIVDVPLVLVGGVDDAIELTICDTVVCTPDVDVVVDADKNVLASALALDTEFSSELCDDRSWKITR